MDIAQLTAFLAPFLGAFLTKSGEAAAAAVSKFGSTAWEHAQKLWARVADRVEERPAAREAVADVAANPASEGARSALSWQLQKLLDADPALAGQNRSSSAALMAAHNASAIASRNILVVTSGTQTPYEADPTPRPHRRRAPACTVRHNPSLASTNVAESERFAGARSP